MPRIGGLLAIAQPQRELGLFVLSLSRRHARGDPGRKRCSHNGAEKEKPCFPH
jgi:hypothetical protein